MLKASSFDNHVYFIFFRLTGDDEDVKLACAKAWAGWELNTLKLIPDPTVIQKKIQYSQWVLKFARIEW